MLDLKMQPAQHAARRRRLIVLYELTVNPTGNKIRALIRLHEVAAIIAIDLYVDDLHAFDRSICERKIPRNNLIGHDNGTQYRRGVRARCGDRSGEESIACAGRRT